jgi:hypothetical protein
VMLDKGGEDKLTDHMKNEVLRIVRDERNILHTLKRRCGNWICHM